MKYYIGIDPGVNTGIAAWNSTKQEFVRISTFDFWGAIDELQGWWDRREYSGGVDVVVILEDPNLESATFLRPGADGRRHTKIAQNVGANKRDAQLVIEWCLKNEFLVLQINPSDRRDTKLKAPAFKHITNFTEPTNEHGRDAAMLVFGR